MKHTPESPTPNELPTVLGVGSSAASAPPLVDVIAEVLAGHRSAHRLFGGEVVCDCGESFGSYRANQWPAAVEAKTAHQARAVLDALTKAGGVEWGVEWEGEYVEEYQPSDKATVQNALKSELAYFKRNSKTPPKGILVSRHATAWTAVEL